MGKEEAAKIWMLQALVKACENRRGYVSAGELAKFMGIARNTAAKRLETLAEERRIARRAYQHGRVTHVQYFRAKPGRI